MLLCIGYNYNEYMITSSGSLNYSMTNSSGSSQCDPKLAIPDVFWDMETYQAIGSKRQIFAFRIFTLTVYIDPHVFNNRHIIIYLLLKG